MDTITEYNTEFVDTKIVEELKDLCRINNVHGFSRLRKDELRILLHDFYKSNPTQLKEDIDRENLYIQNNKILVNSLTYEPQQPTPQAGPIYIQQPVQEIIKHVTVQHLCAPKPLTQIFNEKIKV